MSPRSPGWYPDPTFPTRLRYFDGLTWTNHTDPPADDVRPVVEDEPNATAPPQGLSYASPSAPQHASLKAASSFDGELPPKYSYGRVGGAASNALKANYGRRIVAYLIDSAAPFLAFAVVAGSWIVTLLPMLSAEADAPAPEGVAATSLLTVTVMLVASAFVIWNSLWRQGRTGQSVGKKAMGVALVGLDDDLPIGFGRAFARAILPSVATFLFAIIPFVGILLPPVVALLDYLWPLWDRNGQRLVDKVTNSRVVDADSIGR